MLFRPYYFNHLMALQMTGSAAEVLLPPLPPPPPPATSLLRASACLAAASTISASCTRDRVSAGRSRRAW